MGLGSLYDINSRVLGDEMMDNQPLPWLEKEVRFNTREQKGWLVMTSYSV